jgi:hypothetical protein
MKQLTTSAVHEREYGRVEQPSRLSLGDGGVVDVRPLGRHDRAALAEAFARLSPDSRYLRFSTPKPHLTERELDYLVDVDHHAHEALLAIDPVTRRGVAVVRYVRVPGEEAWSRSPRQSRTTGKGAAWVERCSPGSRNEREKRATRRCAPTPWRSTGARSRCCFGPASRHVPVAVCCAITSSGWW